MSAACLSPAGVLAWGNPIPEGSPGVYVVSLSANADAPTADPEDPDLLSTRAAPISRVAIEGWLEARPELRLDQRRPTISELADRIAGFWLPDEVILYI